MSSRAEEASTGRWMGNVDVTNIQGGLETQQDTSPSVGSTNAPQSTGPPQGSVQIKIVRGTLETQKVEASVSPMESYNPLSTAIGRSLHKVVGSQLMRRFLEQKEDQEVLLGNVVLVKDLPEIPCKSVFFINLAQWNDDPNGLPVTLLRLGINAILRYCDTQRVKSVALPALGAGIPLNFPTEVVAKVILEEVCAFERHRTASVLMRVRIVIHPSESELSQVFKSTLGTLKCRFSSQQKNRGSSPNRIVLLGKTGVGKSSLANVLVGEPVFKTDDSPNSGTQECKSVTKTVEGRALALTDTPGFFDTNLSDEELRSRILNCLTECAPGPHAFLLLLRVDKYTGQEKDVIREICSYFSEEALKYTVIVFTHGDQLPEGVTIMDFVRQNEDLKAMVNKCGGRCHVFDSHCWNNDQPNNYRNNTFQRRELLQTIDEMVRENGGHYTNDLLDHVGELILEEEERLSTESGGTEPMTPKKTKEEGKRNICLWLINIFKRFIGFVRHIIGAFFGKEEKGQPVYTFVLARSGPVLQ